MKAGLGLGALMIGCCAAGPLLVGILGSLTIGSALGWAIGVGVMVSIAFLAFHIRRRRACRPPTGIRTRERIS